MSHPRLALTLGDPAGIGPEVVLRALCAEGRPEADYSVYGSAEVLAERAARLRLVGPESLGVRIVDVPLTGSCPLGESSASGGRAAAEAVLRAAADAMAGRVEGLVTAPLN
jgi:4-hydroxythreonine-4-phosphate dehydrogenase